MTTTIVLLVIGGVALYLVGEQLLRIAGAGIMALALFNGFVVQDDPGLITLVAFLWGLVPWLVGHWIHMTRQGVWASIVAEVLLSPIARWGNQRNADRAAAAVMPAPLVAVDSTPPVALPSAPEAVHDLPSGGQSSSGLVEEVDFAAEDALLFGDEAWEDNCGAVDEVDEVAHLFPYSDRPLGRVVPRSRRRGSH